MDTVTKTPLAPNGKPSNLSPEDWAYVRTPEFKKWSGGDWEKGEGEAILDDNGEPKLLFHGSTRDFRKFDVAHGGDNTGITEYTDPKTGEKIYSDSNRAMFFTDYEPQAVNYALLGRLTEISKIRRAAQEVGASIRMAKIGGIISRYKSRAEFDADVKMLSEFVPSLKNLPKHLSEVPEKERWALSEPVFKLRDEYAANERAMQNGGLCNQYNNTLRQGETIERLIRDFDRLRKNDVTVQGEFGPLSEYNISVFGGTGNPEVSIFEDRDSGRLVFLSDTEGRMMIDEMDNATAVRCQELMRKCHKEAIHRFNAGISEGGYAEAVRVYKVFLKAKNPFAHDYQGSAFPDAYKPKGKFPTAYIAARQVRKAMMERHDMVVYLNIRDPFEATTYGVFRNSQVLVRGVRKGLSIEYPAVKEENREAVSAAKSVKESVKDGADMATAELLRRAMYLYNHSDWTYWASDDLNTFKAQESRKGEYGDICRQLAKGGREEMAETLKNLWATGETVNSPAKPKDEDLEREKVLLSKVHAVLRLEDNDDFRLTRLGASEEEKARLAQEGSCVIRHPIVNGKDIGRFLKVGFKDNEIMVTLSEKEIAPLGQALFLLKKDPNYLKEAGSDKTKGAGMKNKVKAAGKKSATIKPVQKTTNTVSENMKGHRC